MIGNWDAFDFLYNTGMSGIDSLAASVLPGGAGSVLLGLSAAAQATNDALDRGMSQKQAFWNGLAAGIFEGVFEKWSIGNFRGLKEVASTHAKDIAKNIAKSMLVNASEETLTEIANIAYDAIVNGDFSQYDYEENVLFRNKNTPESILEVQHMYQQGGISYTSNLAIRCLPRLEVIDGRPYYDGVEIPELGINANTGSSIRPNEYFVEQQARGSRDKRAHVNMAWGYGGKDFKNASEKKPYLGPKFWCPDLQVSNDGNNYKLFRYADAMLMKAECLHAVEDYKGALTYLNKTRMRAGLVEYTDQTPDNIMTEIMIERGKELFGEFQRKFDLVRWGVFYDTVLETTSYKPIVNALKPCHRYYPIPDSEVARSKYVLDNKEYEQYGF
jgi:uncharacterized protein YukE